jgi:hypothetical protein
MNSETLEVIGLFGAESCENPLRLAEVLIDLRVAAR